MEFIQDTFEQYLGNKEYLSSSGLKQLLKTPRHYAAYLTQGEQEEKDHLIVGSALHCAILEPEEFDRRYFVWKDSMKPNPDKDYRDTENKKARLIAKKLAQMKDQVLLEESQYDDLMQMKASVHANGHAMKLLEGTISEQSVYTEIQVNDTLIKVKVRPDAICDAYYISLKTCNDASPTTFSRKAFNLGYHISEALYTNILERPGYIIAIENCSPFICQVYYTHSQDTQEPLAWLEAGKHSVAMGLLRLEEIMKTGEVKGYDMYSERPDGMLEIKLPAYAQYEVNNLII